MAERRLFNQTQPEVGRKVQVAPVIAPQRSTATSEAFINAMANANSAIVDFMARTARKEGQEAGIKAAKEGSFKEEDSLTTRAQAYNQAGREGYTAAMNTQLSADLRTLFEENKHDPAMLQDNLESYQREMIAQAEQVSPEAAFRLKLSTDQQIGNFMASSTEFAQKMLVENAKAEVELSVEAITSSAEFASANVDPAQSAPYAAMQRAELERMLIANGSSTAFADDKSKYLSEDARKAASQPDGERTGALSAQQIKAALKAYDNKVLVSSYKWGMTKALEEDKGLMFYREVASKPNPTMTTEQHEAVKSEMMSMIREHNSMVSAKASAEKAEREALQETTESELTLAALNGTLDKATIAKSLQSQSIKASTARTLDELVKGGPTNSDGMALMEYQIDNLLDIEDKVIMTDSRLTYADRLKLLDEKKTLSEEQYQWKQSVLGRQANDEIRGAFGILPGTDTSMLTEEQAKKVTNVTSKWFDIVNTFPIDKRKEVSLDVARRLIGEIKTDDLQEEIKKAEDAMYELDYPSEEILDKAVANGDPELTATLFGTSLWSKDEVIEAHRAKIQRKQQRIDRLKRDLEKLKAGAK